MGRALAGRLVKEAEAMGIERIDLEVLPTDAAAVSFWTSQGFWTAGRAIYSRDLR